VNFSSPGGGPPSGACNETGRAPLVASARAGKQWQGINTDANHPENTIMLPRLKALARAIAQLFTPRAVPPGEAGGPIAGEEGGTPQEPSTQPQAPFSAGADLQATPREPAFAALRETLGELAQNRRARRALLVSLALVACGYYVVTHPPLRQVGRGEIGVRVNQLTGGASEWREGSVLVLPGVHQMRSYSLRDAVYRPAGAASASGPAPLQSVEGLSIGVDISVRYALDAARVVAMYKNLPDNVGADVVEPAVQGVIYKVFARYTVREIFSSKRPEIQKVIETELAQALARDGVTLRGVVVGKVDLPDNYKRNMEVLLAEELATEKMRYTLELKEKRVKETELEAQADKVKRETAAEAAGREQVIAAKAQEEAMKHVLPFKQRQIEQRALEAEAEKGARIKGAEGAAQARRIEANGEADARQKLADAEVYRQDKLGKVTAEQMAREGALVTRHPLLVQKAMVDRLSDKIQVIIAPPPADGGFIGNVLLGGQHANQKRDVAARPDTQSAQTMQQSQDSEAAQPKEGE
jgi:regulator of protease activity HflC (stomatin/prohibitin superfamily)